MRDGSELLKLMEQRLDRKWRHDFGSFIFLYQTENDFCIAVYVYVCDHFKHSIIKCEYFLSFFRGVSLSWLINSASPRCKECLHWKIIVSLKVCSLTCIAKYIFAKKCICCLDYVNWQLCFKWGLCCCLFLYHNHRKVVEVDGVTQKARVHILTSACGEV